jgi:WD40 repeat protein
VARYNGPSSFDDVAKAVCVSPNGTRVFVTGSASGGNSLDYVTLAYDGATGAEEWLARYSPKGGYDQATAIGVSPDGATVFVTGQSNVAGTSDDFATVAYDAATGSSRWTARYNGPGNGIDDATAMGVSPDGATVFVTGNSVGSHAVDDYATVAYDATTGAEVWSARYDGPSSSYDDATGLALSPDGSTVFVTGSSKGAGTNDDYATVAYDAVTGAQEWTARYVGPANSDQATAVTVSPDGEAVFVTGRSVQGGSYNYLTVAYDTATGDQEWTARYDGPGDGPDEANAIALSPDGSAVFVTGLSGGQGSSWDYATVAYDTASGSELWTARYNGPGNDNDDATAIGVSPDGGTVFVTGSSDGLGGLSDYATVTYDAATGTQRGVDRPTRGEALALALRPDGRGLFVTGALGGQYTDYGTVAYGLDP